MSNCILKFLLTLCLIFIGLSVNAQVTLPSGLNEDELKLLEVTGIKDRAFRSAISNTVLYEKAWENLRRAGLLIRCAKLLVREGDHHHFDPEIRAAIERIVKKMNAGLLPLEQTLDNFRMLNRMTFWALSSISEAEKQKLFSYLDSTSKKRILQLGYAASILANYPSHYSDPNTGMDMVTAPILLKSYFVELGQLKYLDQIVVQLMPEVLVGFRKLQSMNHYTKADKAWLEPIAEAFRDKSSELVVAFYNVLEKTDAKALSDFFQNDYFKLLEDMKSAMEKDLRSQLASSFDKSAESKPPAVHDFTGLKLGDRKDPRYDAYLLMRLNKDFPLSTEFQEKMFRLGPREYSDNEHLKFCPNPMNK